MLNYVYSQSDSGCLNFAEDTPFNYRDFYMDFHA